MVQLVFGAVGGLSETRSRIACDFGCLIFHERAGTEG
jgi:hypothetical protein